MLASYTRSLPSTRQLTTSKPQQTPSCSRHLFAPSTLSPLIYPHQHSSTSQALKTRARSSRSQSRQVTAMVQSVRDVESSENVLAPCYTKDDLSTGIVHFGIGNFARSHQMSYLEDLLCRNFECAKDWAYTGAGVRASSGKKKLQTFEDQGYRYSILKSNGSGSKQHVQVVGAIREILTGPIEPGELLKRISCSSTRIVSLTITEKGYSTPFSEQDEKLLEVARQAGDGDEVFARADENAKDFDGVTAMGFVIAGLAARRALGNGGMTVMSCDNIPENGSTLHCKIMEKLDSVDKDLKQWVEDKCTFPNCMVDSITPGTDDKVISTLEENFGIKDAMPVPREFYKQWVIEDKFAAGRPAWEDVGAQMVDDVHPYELTKIRMLNVGHTVIALVGILKHLKDVPEAANDPCIDQLYCNIFKNEIRPVLADVPGTSAIDMEKYQECIVGRFKESQPDDLCRMIDDTSAKIRVQMVPAIRDGLKAGLDMKGLAFTIACWGHFIETEIDEGGELSDPRGEGVRKVVESGGVEELLACEEVFKDLASNDEWKETVMSCYKGIKENGVDAAIQSMFPSDKKGAEKKEEATAAA